MRKEDINKLSEPYNNDNDEIHHRFNSAIGADVPSVGKLAEEILNDFDTNSFGIYWLRNMPTEERILVSDYLYQCINSIETNLVEAKLHFMEWLGAREKSNDRVVDAIFRNSSGDLDIKFPLSNAPIDDLSGILENMHICGFFRAIGSTLDCLGGAIIGVLALPINLRKGDIGRAENALKKIKKSGVINLQTDFCDLYENVKKNIGALDWLEWTDQYRNMYVHRGRRTNFHAISPHENPFYDSNGQIILRAETTTNLSKFPDRTDIEAFIKSKDIWLNEDANITLNGIFKSCREFVENISEHLLSIWRQRRSNPTLLEQPQMQWNDQIRICSFQGYTSNPSQANHNLGSVNPILIHRMLSAGVLDHQRIFWENSKWKQ